MKALKDISKFFISFILMFALLITQLSIFERFYFLNSTFYKNILNTTEFFTLLQKEITFGFKNLSMETSIPDEVYSNSFSKAEIKKVSYDNIDNAVNYFKGSTYKESNINTKEVQNTLSNYIDQYAKKNSLELSSDLKTQMGVLTKDAGSIVENHGTLFNISAVSRFSEFQQFRSVIKRIYTNLYAFLIIDLILMLSLFLLNGTNKSKALLWIGSSIISASLMVIVPSIMGIAYKISSRINIGTQYLKLFVNSIILGYLKGAFIIGILSFLIGIVCFVFYNLNRNDAK